MFVHMYLLCIEVLCALVGDEAERNVSPKFSHLQFAAWHLNKRVNSCLLASS